MKLDLNLEEIKYIKIVYKDTNDINHCIKAAVKSLTCREIYACAKTENPIYLKSPQTISLNLICENGLYLTMANLKSIENKDNYVFFSIEISDEFEFKQNREYFRVRMTENVLMRFDQKTYPCKIYDISANGIRIQMDEEIQIPEKVMLDILFAPKGVKVFAKYVRTDNEDNILKASFYFIDLPESARDIISQKCIQKQLIDKRNSKTN